MRASVLIEGILKTVTQYANIVYFRRQLRSPISERV